jgi:4-carboxymuconolactone decarboxylase
MTDQGNDMDNESSNNSSTMAAGARVFAELAPEGATPPWQAVSDIAPTLGAQVQQGLGAIMARPQLDLRTRELATVCMLAALGGCEPQLAFHVGGALRAGASPAEVFEAVSQVYLYAGFPRALNAAAVARDAIANHRDNPGQRA